MKIGLREAARVVRRAQLERALEELELAVGLAGARSARKRAWSARPRRSNEAASSASSSSARARSSSWLRTASVRASSGAPPNVLRSLWVRASSTRIVARASAPGPRASSPSSSASASSQRPSRRSAFASSTGVTADDCTQPRGARLGFGPRRIVGPWTGLRSGPLIGRGWCRSTASASASRRSATTATRPCSSSRVRRARCSCGRTNSASVSPSATATSSATTTGTPVAPPPPRPARRSTRATT